MSNSVWPHRPGSPVPGILQARILEWVAISFSSALKWNVKVKSLKSCPTLSDPMDCSLPGSSVHGVFQARVLEWVAIAFSKTGLILWPQPLPLAMVHTLKSGFSLDPNKSTSYRFVSQWIFAMRHQGLSFISFGRAWVPGESWRTGGKSSGKTCQGIPFIARRKIC